MTAARTTDHPVRAVSVATGPSGTSTSSVASAAFALPVAGDVVAGKYRIEQVVGEGGMGVVYAAHHLILDQRVALKLLLVDALRGDETVERFVREAQAAARLRSEHVARVTDAGALDNGLPFLVMEYLQGCDLAELLHLEGPLPSPDVADCMLQALAALAQAHAAGIVHRDIKPANLFLATREDGSNIVKVLDFGISKQQSSKAQWKELTGKAVLGTPAYMSPEQLRSSKNVDARADVWSLGVVLYELLTGRVPFDGEGPGEIFAAVLEKSPEPLSTHRAGLDRAWEVIVSRCLQRSPEARFQTVAELAQAIAPLGSGQWAHLVPAVELHLSQAAPPLSQTDVAILERAVAAAVTSMPPPMRMAARVRRGSPVPSLRERNASFVTDKTLFAEVLPARSSSSGSSRSSGSFGRMRIATSGHIWLGAIAAVAIAIFAVRVGTGRPAHASAAAHTGSTAAAPWPPPVALPAPVSDSVSAPLPAEAARPIAEPLPAVSTTATTEPVHAAVAVAAPAPSGAARRTPPASAKAAAGDSRPKFLKSWR